MLTTQQQDRDHRIDGERAHVDQLPRQPVCERAGRQREEEQRQELGQADEAEVERIPGDVVDLPADGDEDHLAAEPVGDARRDRERVVANVEDVWQTPSHRPARLSTELSYDAQVRAVVLDADGQPRLADALAPAEPMRVLACGLCGSDVEKIGVAPAGTVLGHEVVAQRADGARIALIHHLPCGECERCRAGHESTCERFAVPTIVPGGFAEEVEAADGIELPDAIGDALGTYLEPLACVLRGAERVPRGRVLVVGQGFVGRLFAAVLRARGRRRLRHGRSGRSCGP